MGKSKYRYLFVSYMFTSTGGTQVNGDTCFAFNKENPVSLKTVRDSITEKSKEIGLTPKFEPAIISLQVLDEDVALMLYSS